jgi:preprotein translocase subunit YajC
LKINDDRRNKEGKLGKRKTLTLGLIFGVLTIALVFTGGCMPEGTEGGTEGITGMWPMLAFLVVLFALMYFVMIRPQRKKQQEHQDLLQELRRGDKVMTAGGIYGQIDSLNDDSVVLKVESGATIRVARSSVVGKRGEQKESEQPRIG